MTEGIMDAPAPAAEPGVDPATPPHVEPADPPTKVMDAARQQADSIANKEFLEALPEALRDMPQMKSIKGTADLATQFVNQQALLGNSLRVPTEDTSAEQTKAFYDKITEVPGVVRLPGDDADEAQWGEFYGKLGVPATPNEYQVNLPEGTTLDPEYLQSATAHAHELKLTNTQFNAALMREIAGQEAEAQKAEEYIDSAKTQLKSIWSNDYEARVAGANSAFRIYKEEMPEFAGELEQFKNNPIFVKLLSDVAEQLQEKGHAGMQAAGNYGLSVEEAKMKHSEIMANPEHPYFQGDQDAINYMLKLNEIIAGGKI